MVEQDNCNPPDIFLLKHDGTVFKSVHLANVENRDWEDMTLSAGPKAGKQYLYIADIGDNWSIRADYAIYRMEEPAAATDTIKNIDKIAFYYPDGSHNAEAILVDSVTKDIYIITKNDTRSKIFKIAWPYSTTAINKAEEEGTLPYNYVVSAAFSPGGKDIVVKTYEVINDYQHVAGETIVQTLGKKPVKLPYFQEPQ